MEMEPSFVKLLQKTFGEPADRLVRPFVEEDGRNVTLAEALMECINALPLTRQQRDPDHPRPCMKLTLVGRYGLEGAAKSFSKLGEDLGVTTQRVGYYEERACRHLRHPRYARRLRRFFVPTPEEIDELEARIRAAEEAFAEVQEDRQHLLGQVQMAQAHQARLEQALERAGGSKLVLYRIMSLGEAAADREAFQRAVTILKERAAQGTVDFAPAVITRLLTALARLTVQSVEDLRVLVESNTIWRVREVGKRGVEVAKEILQIATELLAQQEGSGS